MMLFSLAHAQEAAGTPAQPGFMNFVPIVAIFCIFYFLMIRPQKKKIEEENSMMGALTKGDEIFTKSGIIGTITGMTEKIITLEVTEGVKLKILKNQIGGLSKKLFESKESKDSKEKAK